MSRDIEEILDSCLNMLKQGQSIDDCLKEYPEKAEKLKFLLETSAKLAALPAVDPSVQFVRSAKERILNQATQNIVLLDKQAAVESKAPALLSWPRSRSRVWLMWAAVIGLLVLLLGSGVVSASASTLPGDFLYPVKRGVEEVRDALTFDPESQAELHLDLAERRLNESSQSLKTKDLETTEDLLREVDDELAQARENSAGLEDRQALLEKMITLSERQQAVLWKVYEKVPEKAKEAVSQAIEKSQQGHDRAVQELSSHEKPERETQGEGKRKGNPDGDTEEKEINNEQDSEDHPAVEPPRRPGTGSHPNAEDH